jgi:hypothetical protein
VSPCQLSLGRRAFRSLVAGVALVAALAPIARATTSKKPAPAPGALRKADVRTGRMATPFTDLVKAAKKNDRGALERLASRMGPARLAEALRSPDDTIAQAALAAAPFVRGRAVLTGVVTERLETPRATVAVAAAHALGELLDGATVAELEEWDVPPDTIGYACESLRGMAVRVEVPVPARLAALDALALAQTTCPGTAELVPLLRDPVPAVRRATALALRPSEKPVASALRDTIRDPDPTVASAAVAAVCRATNGHGGPGLAKGDSLVSQSTAAARGLVPAPRTPPEDAVEMLACVSLASTAADRGLLEQLRRGPPSPLRDRAAELTETGGR